MSWCEDIIDYFRSDPEISAAISVEEFQEFFNISSNNFLQIVARALQYQKFDPKLALKQLLINSKLYSKRSTKHLEWDLANINGNFRVNNETLEENKFTNKESLAKDMTFLVTIFLCNNTNIDKLIEKSRYGAVLGMLKVKYGISSTTKASGTLRSTDLTLPRITRVFPTIAVRLFHEKRAKVLVPFNAIPQTSEGITHAICCPLLPSLHPKELAKNEQIHAIMLFVAIKLDETIHKREVNQTSLEQLITYYKLGFDCQITSEKCRLDVFGRYGLLNAKNLSFTPEVVKCNAACLLALKEMRTTDVYHDALMELATNGTFP